MVEPVEATLLPLAGWGDSCPPLRFLRRLSESLNAMSTIWVGSMPLVAGSGAGVVELKCCSVGPTWLPSGISCDGLGLVEPADEPKMALSTVVKFCES